METTNLYLSENELRAVQMLADEKSYQAIRRECHVWAPGKCPSSAMPLFIAVIKRKTGIRDPRDPQQCRTYLENYALATQKPPTPENLETLRRVFGIGYMQPHTMEALANNMHGTIEAAQQAWEDALLSIGVLTDDPAQQRVQARIYLASIKPIIRPPAPIGPKGWQSLRMYLEGVHYADIAKALGFVRAQYAKELVKKTCEELGILARGRGVRKKLIAAALAYHDRQEMQPQPEITMDDPAF